MHDDEKNSPWMCHVCNHTSTIGEGQVCSECYKITCDKHISIETVYNRESGLYELQPICVECRFKKQL